MKETTACERESPFIKKLMAFLLTLLLLHVSARCVAQQVSFSGEKVPLKTVLLSVEKQTGFLFLYPKPVLRSSKPVSINAHDVPLGQFLDQVFNEQPLKYTIKGKSVFISLKTAAPVAEQKVSVIELPRDTMIAITGSVLDEKGEPLVNAVIDANGGAIRTLTGKDGTFKINVPEKTRTLMISFVGMASKEVKLDGKRNLMISMTATNLNLSDVIVIGYNTRITSKENPFAAAKISAKDIENLASPTMAASLRGRVAGLAVWSESGRPGSSVSLNIRNSAVSEQAAAQGATTEPLYVIDDIIVSKSNFEALDPTMVEDMTVLKDAGAAMYGAAGAKGVILIRTKRGKPGKTSFKYNGFTGICDATRFPEMLSAYDHAVLINEANRLRYNLETGDNVVFSDSALEYLKTLPNRGWIEDLWQPSLDQRHSLGISGGGETVTFNVTGSYRNQNGNYAGIKVDRFGLRGNLTMKLSNGFKSDINFSAENNIERSNNPNSSNDQDYLERVFTVPRWVPRQINGMWVNPLTTSSGGFDNFNPWAQIASGYYDDRKGRSFNGNASLAYAPETGILKGLSLRVTASVTGSMGTRQIFQAPYTLGKFKMWNTVLYTDSLSGTNDVKKGTDSRLNRSMSEGSNYRIFFTASYAREIGKHKFSIMGTAEQTASKSSDMEITWQEAQVPGFDDPFAYLQTIGSNWAAKANGSTKRSFLSRFNYGYGGKYIIDGIVRFDASSNFARGEVWGISPTVGANWIVSDENFFKDNITFINYLKLRTSVGITGDDRINSRLWQDRFKVSKESAVFGDTLTTGIKQLQYPNPNITWERKRTINFGIEIGLFNNRLNLGVEMFQNFSYNAFDKNGNEAYPAYSGFVAPVVNYQQRYGWGTEFSISYNQPFRNDWNLKVSTNFGFANQVLTQAVYAPGKVWINWPNQWLDRLGTNPRIYTGDNYGLISLGMLRTQADVDAILAKNPNYTVFGNTPQPGWLNYKDVNQDGKITQLDKTIMYPKGTQPWLNTGTQIGVTHKAFSLNINIGAQFGGKLTYDTDLRKSEPKAFENVATMWRDRWTPDNPNGKFPRADDASIGEESTFWSFNATTIRVYDMNLSYRMPAGFVKRIGFSNMAFNMSAVNPFVIVNPTPYKDPQLTSVYDYPTLRTITIGLNFGF